MSTLSSEREQPRLKGLSEGAEVLGVAGMLGYDSPRIFAQFDYMLPFGVCGRCIIIHRLTAARKPKDSGLFMLNIGYSSETVKSTK